MRYETCLEDERRRVRHVKQWHLILAQSLELPNERTQYILARHHNKVGHPLRIDIWIGIGFGGGRLTTPSRGGCRGGGFGGFGGFGGGALLRAPLGACDRLGDRRHDLVAQQRRRALAALCEALNRRIRDPFVSAVDDIFFCLGPPSVGAVVDTPPPALHLAETKLRDAVYLVAPLQRAVVALVEPP